MGGRGKGPMNIALVLSGGIGSRLISEVPKQYVTVRGKMVVIHCLQVLCAHPMIDAVHVVAERAWWEPVLTELPDVSKLKGFSVPGENRQLSILNGLADMERYADDDDVVLIHDAVRPLVSNGLISDTLSGATGHDGCVPVLPMKDTVYLSGDGVHLTERLERSKILAGQAPEAFVYGKYRSANEQLTDDEMMGIYGSAEPALMGGLDIATVQGDERNFKITTNGDLERYRKICEQVVVQWQKELCDFDKLTIVP